MYYYAPDNNHKGRRIGIIATVCYLVVFMAISLGVSFRIDYEPYSEGILVDFGDGESGTGDDNVALSLPEEAATLHSAEEELLTQDSENAPAVRTDETPRAETSATGSTERQVNRRALFPGRSTISTAQSQGHDSAEAGNSGNAAGGDGSASGTGTGTEGVSFDLAGRMPIGNLPRPAYNSNDAQGIVVVEITVDASGRVQSALFRPQGSTTQDARLMEAAMRAARQARFSPSENNAVQRGTITYVFRLQ